MRIVFNVNIDEFSIDASFLFIIYEMIDTAGTLIVYCGEC